VATDGFLSKSAVGGGASGGTGGRSLPLAIGRSRKCLSLSGITARYEPAKAAGGDPGRDRGHRRAPCSSSGPRTAARATASRTCGLLPCPSRPSADEAPANPRPAPSSFSSSLAAS